VGSESEAKIQVSSAKVLRMVKEDVGISAVYIRYKSGETSLPWGTPALIINWFEIELFKFTWNER
jgi:hypothetical protein